jgi:hypothetical protein
MDSKVNESPPYPKVEDPRNMKPLDADLHQSIEYSQKLEELLEDLASSAPDSRPRGRIHAIDNLRTVLIILLILEHTILETVSTAKLVEESKSLTTLNLFVGMTRTHVVGMLYFISGFASRISITLNSPNSLFFLAKKAGKAAIAIVACQFITGAIRYLYGPWLEATGSFYSSFGGKAALMNGPMYYIVLLLILDTTFAILRFLNHCTGMFSRKIITSATRYIIAKHTLLAIVEIWTVLFALGCITVPSRITALLSAVDATPPFFPVQYIVSYFIGIHFMEVWRFMLFEVQPELHVPMFIVRTITSIGTLYALLHYYPEGMQRFFSITTAQTMTFPSLFPTSNSVLNPFTIPLYLYILWSIATYFILPTSMVALFFTSKTLNRDWGLFSHAAFTQPFIHMIFVIGFSRQLGRIPVDNIILKCVIVGVASLVCGWSVAVVFADLVKFLRQLLVDMRGPRTTDEEKNII